MIIRIKISCILMLCLAFQSFAQVDLSIQFNNYNSAPRMKVPIEGNPNHRWETGSTITNEGTATIPAGTLIYMSLNTVSNSGNGLSQQTLNPGNYGFVQVPAGGLAPGTSFTATTGYLNLQGIIPVSSLYAYFLGDSKLTSSTYLEFTLIVWGTSVPTTAEIASRTPANDGNVSNNKTTTVVYDPNGVLPVTFGDIQATISSNDLKVQWNTLSETNNDYFDIEGSTDGVTFNKIGSLKSKAIAGNSSEAIQYNWKLPVTTTASLFAFLLIGLCFNRKSIFIGTMLIAIVSLGISCTKKNNDVIDKKHNLFIRIAQVDIDGKRSYSKTIKVIQE